MAGDDKTGDTGRGQGSQDTRDQSRDGKSRDVTTARWGELAKDTDLNTKGTNVAETAEGVGGDETRSGAEVGVFGRADEGAKGIVLVLQHVLLASSAERMRYEEDLR